MTKPRMRFSSKIVIASVCAILGYTITMFALEWENIAHNTNVQMPTDFTVSWFAFWTVEIVCLASIRRNKIKNKYEYDDPDRMKSSSELNQKNSTVSNSPQHMVDVTTITNEEQEES